MLVHCNIFLCMRSDKKKKMALILWPLKQNEGINTVSTVKWLSPPLDPCICSFPTLDGCLCYMCFVSAPVQPSSCCFCWALEMQGWAKDFLFLLIMLWDTRVMKTHSYTDIAPDLMFWCLNLPALHFFLWSHEQWIKYTVIRKVRYRCTLTGVKVHLSRFKNKLYAMSILIYIPQISCGAGEASIKLTGFKTSQEYY